MATNESADATGDERQQARQSAPANAAGAQPAGGASAGAAGPDQERPMEVSREGSPQAMQPGESGTDMSPARHQGAPQGAGRTGMRGAGGAAPSLLPAFMANPGLMASAFMANPFEFANLMTGEMDRIFETFGIAPGGASRQLGAAQRGGGTQRESAIAAGQPARRAGGTLASFTPQIEVVQRGNELVLRADLPGMQPDDVTVEVDEGMLAISGERREEVDDRREGFYHSERRYGSFYRAVPLPEGVSEEQINASFRDGVLEVTVPLPRAQPQARGRRIPIQGAGGGAGGAAASGGFSTAAPRGAVSGPGPTSSDPGTSEG